MPTYTAHLTRSHKTETRLIKPSYGDMRGIKRPITSYERVEVDFPRPVLSQEDFAQFRQLVIAAASPETSGWGHWNLKNALENGSYPPPPPMLTPEKSLAGKAWKRQAEQYPILYGDDPYTPYRVLEHWFCTIGNGMEWNTKGHYVSKTRYKAKTDAVREEDKAMIETSPYWHLKDDVPYVKDEVGLYPLSDNYSDIFNLPENIENSFLLAAVDICNYYLARPVRYCVAYSPSDIERGIDYDKNTWQKMVMDNADIFRTKLENAYAGIWKTFGTRLIALGVEKVNYVRDNNPFGQFVPGDEVWEERGLSPEQLERRDASVQALLAQLRK